MLRISAIEEVDEPVTLRLDGQVAGKWVKLLERVCEAELEKHGRVTIDLRNVSFADRDGIEFLQNLTDHKVELLNASPFVAEQIRKVTPE
jgi:anti-anti-sigma regulatory factor